MRDFIYGENKITLLPSGLSSSFDQVQCVDDVSIVFRV